MKKKVLNWMGLLVCIACLVVSYYFWSDGKNRQNQVATSESEYKVEKVVAYDYAQSYIAEGIIASCHEKTYTLDASVYEWNSDLSVGSLVDSGDLLATYKYNSAKNQYSELAGTITKIKKEETEISVTIKDLINMKVTFYVPQLYCNDYEIDSLLEVTVNGKTYEGTISKIGYEMKEISISDDSGNESKLNCVYMEAKLDRNEGLFLNEKGEIVLKHVTGENTKSVPKKAIIYDGDTPYVKVVTESEQKLVEVQLGNSDEKMTEIISDQIHVGTEVIVE